MPKKRHPEHVNLERWLVSYADFITLLFAFFVVMYAISQTDIKKLKSVAEGMRAAFGAKGPVGMLDIEGKSGGQTMNPFDHVMAPGGRAADLPAGKTHTSADPDPALQSLKEKLEESISLEMGTSQISDPAQILYDPQGLLLRLTIHDFFEPGHADASRDLWPTLDKLGRVLIRFDRPIRIEGHVDPGEVDAADGWDLSTRRAVWIAKYWIKNLNMNPQKIGVAGYSYHRPIRSGKGNWERGANRRFEVMVPHQQNTN